LVAPQILRLCLVRRATQEPGKVPDHADIEALRLGAELANGHVVDQPLTQRADGCDRHGSLLSEGGWTPDLQTGPAELTVGRAITAARTTHKCRGSGLVLRPICGRPPPRKVVVSGLIRSLA